METFSELTEEQMLQTAKWINETGLPLAVHAEDKSIVTERRDHLNSIGNKDWQAYYFARDEKAEALAVMKMIDICRQTGCKIHIVHLSSQFGVELIRQARKEGLPVTAETCPHYLFFTKDDFDNPKISAWLKTAPPVKTEFDRLSLWEALKDETLQFVTTDHAGCDPEKEKKGNDFWEIYGGIPGVEHRVPFLFSEGFKRGRLSLENTINLLSTNAASYFNFTSKGQIAIGFDADFCLINLWDKKTVKARNMHSKGKYTPFEDITLNTVIDKTFVRGDLLIEGDKYVGRNKIGKMIQILNRGEIN
jgi:dihydroorotase-like cyclic amidohydrolase